MTNSIIVKFDIQDIVKTIQYIIESIDIDAIINFVISKIDTDEIVKIFNTMK